MEKPTRQILHTAQERLPQGACRRVRIRVRIWGLVGLDRVLVRVGSAFGFGVWLGLDQGSDLGFG